MKILIKIIATISLCLCIATAGYLWFVAENRYTSVSQFSVVVDDNSSSEFSMGLLALAGPNNTGSADTQSAIGFIQSSDLLLELEEEFNLHHHFSSPAQDLIFRLSPAATLEDRLAYYRSHISAVFNAATGLIELEVETFDSQLSHKLSEKILSRTEEFINKLNQEIAEKRLDFVKSELSRSHELIKKTEQALLTFQNTHKIIQPEAIIKAQLEAIQALRIEKINKEIQLSTLEASSPQSPLISPLKLTVKRMEEEIARQEAALSGSEQKKLNQLLAEYKELQLNLSFAINLRKGAEILLEKTRSEAISHSRYFSVIQNPYLAEDSINPRRSYLTITILAAILLTQYILTAMIRSIIDKS